MLAPISHGRSRAEPSGCNWARTAGRGSPTLRTRGAQAQLVPVWQAVNGERDPRAAAKMDERGRHQEIANHVGFTRLPLAGMRH